MLKVLRWLSRIFISLITIGAILMVGAFLFVNPNQFKGNIEQLLLSQTGQKVSIQGPLTWRWSPMLSLELNKVAFENAPPFKDKLLTAESIQTSISPKSLLLGKVFLTIKLEGIDVILERNAKGYGNWEPLLQHLVQTKKSIHSENVLSNYSKAFYSLRNSAIQNISTSTHQKPVFHTISSISTSSASNISAAPATNSINSTNTNNEKTSRLISIMLNDITIKNGKLTFHDEQKNNHYMIDNLNLNAKNLAQSLLGVNNPIALSLELIRLDTKNKIPLGKFALNGSWSLKQAKDELAIEDLTLAFESPNAKKISIKMDIDAQNLTHNFSIQGKLKSTELDIMPLLYQLGVNHNLDNPLLADIKFNFKYKAPYLSIEALNIDQRDRGIISGNLKVDTTKLTPKTLHLDGNFLGENLIFNKLRLDEIKGNIIAKDGIINIAPIHLKLAQSLQNATIQADFRGNTPKYTFTEEGRDFEIKHILLLFGIKDKLEGKTNIKIKLTASGNKAEELRQSLSGNTEIEMHNGKFFGINLISVLKDAQSGIHSVVASVTNKDKFSFKTAVNASREIWKQHSSIASAFTPFNAFKASTIITNGVVRNENLAINHSEYVVNGEGTINLLSNAIQYYAGVLLKNNPYPENDEIGNYLYNTPLPVKIQGTLKDLFIRPDLETYTNNAVAYAEKKVAQKIIKQNVEKAMDKTLNKTLEKATDKIVDKETISDLLNKVTGN